MENESKFKRFFSKLGDSIAEQGWFQQFKAKWDELDARTKVFVQFGGIVTGVVLVLFVTFSSIWGVRSQKLELAEKNGLLSLIQSANDEMKRLRDSGGVSGAAGGGDGGPEAAWDQVFQGIATASSVDKTALSVSEAKAGTGLDAAKEFLFDLTLKGVNVRQVARFAFTLENGARPIKLRHLAIDTKDDMSGYLDAVLSVSAFVPKE